MPEYFKAWVRKKFQVQGIRAMKVLITDEQYRSMLAAVPIEIAPPEQELIHLSSAVPTVPVSFPMNDQVGGGHGIR